MTHVENVVAARQPNGGGDPPEITPTINVIWTAPASLTVSGAQPGTPLLLTGTLSAKRLTDLAVRVRIGSRYFPATLGNPVGTSRPWQCPVRFYTAGAVTAQAEASGTFVIDETTMTDTSITRTFTVTLARAVPDLTILAPVPGDVPVSEAGELLALRASTSEGYGPRSITWQCEGRAGGATPVAGVPGEVAGQVPLNALPLGPRIIAVQCVDAAGNATNQSVTVTAVDRTPPDLVILDPKPSQAFVAGPAGTTIRIRGQAGDQQSGMTGGRVEWSLAGGPFTAAVTTDDWANWQADVPITEFGTFFIDIRATDPIQNARTLRLPIQVISGYRPPDLLARLDPRSYLAALLTFARDTVRTAAGGSLSTGDLQTTFAQPFATLSQALSEIGDAGVVPVNQLLVVAETLRRYGATAPPRLLAGRWSFDASSVIGDTAEDLSGNGNAATFVGGTVLEPGRAGGHAARFDGTRSVQVDPSAGLRVGADDGDFTVAFHIRLEQGATGEWRTIAHKGPTSEQRTFGIWLFPDRNRLHVRISTTADWNEGLDSVAELPVGVWTHVGYVKRGAELRLYLDGRLDRAVTLSGRSVANDGPIYVGKDPWWPGVNALIDDLHLYRFAVGESTLAALTAGPAAAPLATEAARARAAYLWAAYEAFLAGIGTSYSELRLMRGADLATRAALAARLGIRLTVAPLPDGPFHPGESRLPGGPLLPGPFPWPPGPGRLPVRPGRPGPDELIQMTLDPHTIDEPTMERLFGLHDTDAGRNPLRATGTPLLLRWRSSAQTLGWAEADHGPAAADRAFGAIIDPDLIRSADLAAGAVSGPAQVLLDARRDEVRAIRDALHTARTGGGGTAAAQIAALLNAGLPGVDLPAIRARELAGDDVGPALRAIPLPRTAFRALLSMINVAQRAELTDTEWDDAYDILTQVEKAHRYPVWRGQETLISLSPDYFRVDPTFIVLPRWRATAEAREEWQRLLRSRIDDRDGTTAAYQAVLDAVESATLSLLRDALVAESAGSSAAADAGDRLTDRLQIDVRASGALQTTRIGQATETLQNVLFAVRTGQLGDEHPARGWSIVDEPAFDDAWRWIGTYEAWRAAMLVYLYPENLLQPGLRPNSSQPFSALVSELRQRQRISAEDARRIAARFLAAHLPSLHATRLPATVAAWTFDEAGGNTANDPGGSPGTLSGPVWTTGAIGGALSFDGIDDRVTVAHSAALKAVANTFTISLWVRPEATHQIDVESTTGTSGVSGQRYAYGPMQGQSFWNSATDAGVGISVGTNGVSVYEHTGAYLPAVLAYGAPISGWTHVAVVYDDRRPRLYVNGRLVRSRATQSPMTGVHPAPDGLGGMGYGYLQGQLDDVRVYPAALGTDALALLAFRLTDQRSDAELDAVRALSAALGTGGPAAELFAYVPLALAQKLQTSGEYLAALDWYQNVYAYQLPPARRLIYAGLAQERNTAPDLTIRADWTARLNPFLVAASRPNPLTRFALLSLARCCADFADAEFTRDTADAVARARSLYLTALDQLDATALMPVIDQAAPEWPLPNPVHQALRSRVLIQLAKLRQGRNVAGIRRTADIAAPTGLPDSRTGAGAGGPVAPQRLRPTPYRYRVLADRSRQLVAMAQQVENAYLDALEKFDNAAFRRFDANKGVELAQAGVVLSGLRVTEATQGVALSKAQRQRADGVAAEYQRLIDAGLNEYENQMLQGYWEIKTLRDVIGGIDAAIGAAGAAMQAAGLIEIVSSFGARAAIAGGLGVGYLAKAVAGGFLDDAEARLQSNSLLAGHERLVEGWQLQVNLAAQDALVADQQVLLAGDQKDIALQEERVARLQQDQATATVEFLDRQFTNADLYEWMSAVLGGIYRYFLQQATSLARLAQDQLSFERQEPPAAILRDDYWEPPADGGANTSGRRGLTGSARLLQDITQLDQYAFDTDKRKLNLSQTFSLAQRMPLQFELFRSTGVLTFGTPTEWFDRDFPGHYLRLIRRVSVTIVGLLPPGRGVRATLLSSGISRVVVAGDTFREVVMRRDPERIALTSPVNATGVFDLDTQSDLLAPFEGHGVDSTWELQLPRAANPIDYTALADVLLTIEYTALHNDDYRAQVVSRLNLDRRVGGDRAFSVRQDFPDQWYDLHNPSASGQPRTARLVLTAADLPSNLDQVVVDQVVLYLIADDPVEAFEVTLDHAGRGGAARHDNGLISTRRGNAPTWEAIRGQDPVGRWDLSFDADGAAILDGGLLTDILLVVGYAGRAPLWPA